VLAEVADKRARILPKLQTEVEEASAALSHAMEASAEKHFWLENTKNDLGGQEQRAWASLAHASHPAIRAELSILDAQIALEQKRIVANPIDQPNHELHVRSLQDVRSQVEASVMHADEEIPARIAALRATIRPPLPGVPPRELSMREKLWEGIRNRGPLSTYTNPNNLR
jgi:hypothetical protein